MFQEATSFNKSLDKWYPKSVENLTFMFSGAAAFNQNLCSWHYKLPPKTNALNMFGFSACPDTMDPNVGIANTPFCQLC